MHRKTGILTTEEGKPAGGRLNFDAENRGSFGKNGPGAAAPVKGFRPDAVTRHVLKTVVRRFGERPGSLGEFDRPVTPRRARAALDEFIENRLGDFGRRRDAMRTGERLFHSRLSSAMNLKLIDPRVVIAAAEDAYGGGAVERVELPNTLGMSQFADGGIMAPKPYAASGACMIRMSSCRRGWRHRPAAAVGEDACPFTTFY